MKKFFSQTNFYSFQFGIINLKEIFNSHFFTSHEKFTDPILDKARYSTKNFNGISEV